MLVRRAPPGGAPVGVALVVAQAPRSPPKPVRLPAVRLRPHRQRQRRLPGVRDGGSKGDDSMKRVLRWLWNGLAMLSLVLCLLTAFLWARSGRQVDYLEYFGPSSERQTQSS